MPRSILVTGATGQQGGAVVDNLLEPASDFSILAVTRDPESASAKRLAAKSPTIKLVKGNLDNVPALFESAKAASPEGIWGVFSVQVPGKLDAANVANSPEAKQGIDLIDAAKSAGVKHFVQTSVDRGGDEKSWTNPTPIAHFQTKHAIELHLRDTAGDMGWTILRPVIFFDNIQPAFTSTGFMTLLRDTMGTKRMPWVACSDIGYFAAAAFRDPKKYNHKAIALAGDEFDWKKMNEVFQKVTGKPVPTTYSFLAYPIRWVADMGTMVDWFRDEGYQADVAACRKENPKMQDLEAYLRASKFPKV